MSLISRNNIKPNCLELELTERMIVQDMKGTIKAMNELRSLGIKIAIDDFGTGVSAFVYLKQFPVNTMKIDREFVQDVGNDYKKAGITKALIEMGHSLNLKIVAEGVETESELAFLRENKCDSIQGFICSPALPSLEFKKLLLTNQSLAI
jgi:EAL domain-containing protein (putative c-di-GMP-specific phosphodiesterase class I)